MLPLLGSLQAQTHADHASLAETDIVEANKANKVQQLYLDSLQACDAVLRMNRMQVSVDFPGTKTHRMRTRYNYGRHLLEQRKLQQLQQQAQEVLADEAKIADIFRQVLQEADELTSEYGQKIEVNQDTLKVPNGNSNGMDGQPQSLRSLDIEALAERAKRETETLSGSF